MKKFIFLAFCALTPIFLCSCDGVHDYEDRISQLRTDVFYYECEDYKLYAFAENSETPAECDGIKGQTENKVVFRLNTSGGYPLSASPKIEFSLENKKHVGQFGFRPASASMDCTIPTETLPVGILPVMLKINGENVFIELYSLKNDRLISYKEVIKKLKYSNNNLVSGFTANPENYELNIRLTENDGYNFWCINIFGIGGESVFMLFDGENGEEIAVRNDEK